MNSAYLIVVCMNTPKKFRDMTYKCVVSCYARRAGSGSTPKSLLTYHVQNNKHVGLSFFGKDKEKGCVSSKKRITILSGNA